MPIYMKFEGIEGPVTGKYKGWIELSSCQIGVRRNITTSTGSVNREASVPSVSELVITKEQDSASTSLFKAALSGEGKKVTIVFVHGNDAPYLTIELGNTLVSSYNVSGSGGDINNRPMESLTLDFATITYKAQAAASDPKDLKDKATWQLVQ